MSEVDKTLLAFLNGLCKRIFFGETEITDEFLRSDVLGGLTQEGTIACWRTIDIIRIIIFNIRENGLEMFVPSMLLLCILTLQNMALYEKGTMPFYGVIPYNL